MAGTAATGRRRRRYGTLGDMVRTMLVIGVVVFIAYLFTPHNSRGAPPPLNVNAAVAGRALAAVAPFPVLLASTEPTGWRCTHASAPSVASGLSVGYDDVPDNAYVQLTESATPPGRLLTGQDVQAASEGSITAAGRQFSVHRAGTGPGDVALSLALPHGATVLIDGGAPLPALAELADRLVVLPPGARVSASATLG